MMSDETKATLQDLLREMVSGPFDIDTLNEAADRLDALEAELSEANKTLEKLPVTADGVRVVPGMTIYAVFFCRSRGGLDPAECPNGECVVASVGGIFGQGCGIRIDGFEYGFSGECFYSTREAAEAAAKETP